MPNEKSDLVVIGAGTRDSMCALKVGASHPNVLILIMPAGSPIKLGFLEAVDAISKVYLLAQHNLSQIPPFLEIGITAIHAA